MTVVDELVPEDGRYGMDLARLERLLADPTLKLLILCNPHNPPGRAWTRDELARVAELCERHDVLVIADEIHGDLVMPGHRFTPFATLALPAAPASFASTPPARAASSPKPSTASPPPSAPTAERRPLRDDECPQPAAPTTPGGAGPRRLMLTHP